MSHWVPAVVTAFALASCARPDGVPKRSSPNLQLYDVGAILYRGEVKVATARAESLQPRESSVAAEAVVAERADGALEVRASRFFVDKASGRCLFDGQVSTRMGAR